MTRKVLFFVLSISFVVSANAQTKKAMGGPTRPQQKWEVGVGLGHMMANSDVKYKPGFGGTIHVRRAIDHIFSIRLNGQVGVVNFKDDATVPDRNRGGLNSQASLIPNLVAKGLANAGTTWFADVSTSYLSGSIEGLMSLNNFDFTRSNKKWDPYIGIGVGASSFTAKAKLPSGDVKIRSGNSDKEGKLSPIARPIIGISYKISPKLNISIEQTADFVFGNRADLVDGINYYNVNRQTPNNDVVLYTNVRLNFNLGKKEAVEPLYWSNPLGQIQDDIAELKARPKFDPTDTDADGVIDMFDQEKNTPAGYSVDTRGVTLDSDTDGVANAMDKEPFSPPGFKVDKDGIANVPKPNFTTEADVNRIVDSKLADMKASMGKGIVDWFLPMINFDFNKATIKQTEYEQLAYVANVVQRNPKINIVVTGYTDGVASPSYNENLSYDRSEAAINYLVNKYSIDRNRFVLNYNGENTKLVDTNSKSYINRRAEFKVSTGTEKDMARPAGASMKKSTKFKGNKEAGY
ncbi:MAG: OmpA family protein [Saprospiraceae bacterium]